MATAPAVQSLDEVVASLNPIYQSSQDSINAQKALIPQKYDAQRSALDAAKVQGFDQINNQATGRGVSFSGVPINEQSKYLSTTYLPGIQQANYQQNADSLALDQSLAQLDLQKGTQAYNTRQTQQSTLDSYLQQQAQNEFTAQQSALDRAASAAQAAASRSASSQANAAPTLSQYISELLAGGYTGDNQKNGWTENYAVGNVANAYGISKEEALKQIYAQRGAYETKKK